MVENEGFSLGKIFKEMRAVLLWEALRDLVRHAWGRLGRFVVAGLVAAAGFDSWELSLIFFLTIFVVSGLIWLRLRISKGIAGNKIDEN